MNQPRMPNKGPQGKDLKSHSKLTPDEPQEVYEANGVHADLVMEGIRSFEDMKADKGDHTPDNSAVTHKPRVPKPNYGKSEGNGNGGY